jgi:hypothetical protein
MRLRPVLLALLVLTTGCTGPTTFTGGAHFPDGPGGCQDKCKEGGLEFAAFVYAGEYSSACVCQAPSELRARTGARVSATAADAGSSAAVGVMTQMREAAAERERQAHKAEKAKRDQREKR